MNRKYCRSIGGIRIYTSYISASSIVLPANLIKIMPCCFTARQSPRTNSLWQHLQENSIGDISCCFKSYNSSHSTLGWNLEIYATLLYIYIYLSLFNRRSPYLISEVTIPQVYRLTQTHGMQHQEVDRLVKIAIGQRRYTSTVVAEEE